MEKKHSGRAERPIVIALAGNPNAGKTTIFNCITGSRQHVGNYPGITVDKKVGETFLNGERVLVVDLPGTYSLTAYSQEEIVARRMLADERPDAVLHVVDSGALERNLYLTVQLMELGIPVVVALNMMDEVRSRGDSIDSAALARMLATPVVETVGRTGLGLQEALRVAVELGRAKRGTDWKPLEISYGNDLDPVLADLTADVEQSLANNPDARKSMPFPPRWIALKFLENDMVIRQSPLFSRETLDKMDAACNSVTRHLADTLKSYPEAVIADFRYGFISSMMRQGVVTRHVDLHHRRHLSDYADKLLTHRLLGPLIMIAVFYGIYQAAFSLGSYPMDMVDAFFGWLGETVSSLLDDGLLKSLLVSGIIKGVGGVLTFVPLILIMFLLIALLEDSGYMARIAYMLDRVFRVFGLHGASVMPYLISGGIAGGCAVPGVMATRTLRSPKERLATLLTVPFMACGAKIPVFTLLVGAFFLESQRATIMLLITLAGWVLALVFAWVLRSTIITGDPTPFVMELPPYRLPTLRGLLLHTWERGWQYIKKAGTIILAISILLWAAMTFPGLPEDQEAQFAQRRAVMEEKVEKGEAPKEELHALLNDHLSTALRHSLAGRIGTALEPVTRYAGFEWRTNIALLGGFAAKEVLVSTLSTAYALGEADPEESQPLAQQLKADPHWSKANALSLLVFVLLYAPCVVTIAAMRAETGGWHWPMFSLVFSTVVAYGMAVAVYQVARLLV